MSSDLWAYVYTSIKSALYKVLTMQCLPWRSCNRPNVCQRQKSKNDVTWSKMKAVWSLVKSLLGWGIAYMQSRSGQWAQLDRGSISQLKKPMFCLYETRYTAKSNIALIRERGAEIIYMKCWIFLFILVFRQNVATEDLEPMINLKPEAFPRCLWSNKLGSDFSFFLLPLVWLGVFIYF